MEAISVRKYNNLGIKFIAAIFRAEYWLVEIISGMLKLEILII